MRLTIKESLEYMKDAGFHISQATYCRIKSKLQNDKLKRIYNIAKFFQDSHLERIDQLELIQKLMWTDYHNCRDPFKRSCILEKIVSIQPYLSAYLEATRDIIEHKKLEEIKKRKKVESEQEDQYIS